MPWTFFHKFTPGRDLYRALATHSIDTSLALIMTLGDLGVGLVALEAYHSDEPEVTAEYVAERLDGYFSDDTTRRRLLKMAQTGILTHQKVGRTVYFRLKPGAAEAATRILKSPLTR